MNIGDKVIYNLDMPALIKGEIGELNYIGENHVSIVYPQNSCFDENGKIKDHPTWSKVINGKLCWLPYVYAHSARFNEFTILPNS